MTTTTYCEKDLQRIPIPKYAYAYIHIDVYM